MEIERPKPIAEQIYKILHHRIQVGEYAPGSRIPTERELIEEFGVSRTTLRVSLASLITDGLIRRRQGDGTYVSKKAMQFSIHERGFRSYCTVLEESGYKPSIHNTSIFTRKASTQESRVLELDPGAQIASLTQVIYADHKPAIYLNYIIPIIFFPNGIKECKSDVSINEFLKEHCNQKIAYISREISAAIATPELMKVFNLTKTLPFLRITDRFFNDDDIPILLSISYYDDSFMKVSLIHKWND